MKKANAPAPADVQVLLPAAMMNGKAGITYREDKPELVAALAAMHASGFYPKERLF